MKRNAAIVGTAIVLLLLLSAAALLFMKQNQKEGTYVCIYQNNVLVKKIDIREGKKPYTIKIEGENNAYNILEIRENSVGIVDASCPEHLCQNMGFISGIWMPITCLPNHLVIRLETEAEDTQNTMDGIAY